MADIKKGFKILKATFGVLTNKQELLGEIYFGVFYESLLTDFYKVEEIEYSDKLDFYITMLDEPAGKLSLTISENQVLLAGPVVEATKASSDLRFTIFGNEGFVFRYVMRCMEENYNIWSFHACALYDEKKNHMYIAPGGAGSGKTCLILKGLEQGLKIFSTEMTHFSFEGKGLRLYKGSLVDNIRVGNLKYSYPAVPKKLGLTLPETADEWGKKIAVDLTKEQTKFDTIDDTNITVILPHIEEGRDKCIAIDVKNPKAARKALFDNISDKIANNVLYYDVLPLGGFDTPELMKKRVAAVDKFLTHIKRIAKVTAGSQNCWEGILNK